MARTLVIEGNHAASYGAMLARAQVYAAYPITPQTQIVELLSELCASGQAEGAFIKVESEHSAMATCVGAAQAGARAFTATSAHGLALMHEMLHWATGARLPIVLCNINRAMGPPWSIWADQTDSLAQRDTGLIQYYAESNQEILDSVIQAYKVSEQVLLPGMISFDAFFLSHTTEPVELPDQELVDRYLPPYAAPYRLDPENPCAFGCISNASVYMEFRYKIAEAQKKALPLIVAAGREFGEMFGRPYGLIEEYRTDGAELLLVTAGSATSTARITVDRFRDKGIPVGLLKIRVLRPFPVEEVRKAVDGVEKVTVVDRNFSFGASGIFFQELKAALYNSPARPPVFGFVAGIGGRDITPDTFAEALRYTMEYDQPEQESIWLGLKR
jgi:pyruvate/2-oxoacid:ferredoxin oxidoreductase alpha subunit